MALRLAILSEHFFYDFHQFIFGHAALIVYHWLVSVLMVRNLMHFFFIMGLTKEKILIQFSYPVS